MPKGNPSGNPDILIAAAEAKRKEALERTEQAITELVKSGSDITFKSVAEKAGVSVPYLYKYNELKERIQHLRNQQKQQARKRSKKPQSFQPASDKSKQTIIYSLKEDNRRLRSEIDKQREHIEIIQGKLYEMSELEQDNNLLKRHIGQITAELESTRKQLNNYLLAKQNGHSKVTPIESKRNSKSLKINNEIKSKLSELGVTMNANLKKIIESKSSNEINNALSAVEEYLATGTKVKSKVGLFRKALEESWTPNLTDEEREISQVTDDFSEWFKLAKEQGLVQASQGTKDGIIVLEPTGQWTSLTIMLEKGWTLEYLQQRSKR